MSKTHVVEQGDCLHSLAARYGFASYRDLYDHADNRTLRERRDRADLLVPGDQVAIPDPTQKEDSAQTGTRIRYTALGQTVRLRLVFRDDQGHAHAHKRYRLSIEGADDREGRTDGSGHLDEPIPATSQHGRVELWLSDDREHGYVFPLRVGHLDPVDTLSGAQARLRQLGFPCAVTGRIDDDTSDALCAFQSRHGLEQTGELDEATRRKLVEKHDR